MNRTDSRKGIQDAYVEKLLSCCLCLMLVLSSFAPMTDAEGEESTSSDLPCKHTDTTDIVRTVDTDDICQYSTAAHIVVVETYIRTVCNACHEEIAAEHYTGLRESARDHTMVDGVCSVCDWAGCEHANQIDHRRKGDDLQQLHSCGCNLP